jgi:RNA polymerase sigma-70 factor (ECF subfamily)
MTVADRESEATTLDQNDLIALIPHMRGFAQSLCRDATQAHDLTQDALESAWRFRASYTPGTNLKAWVFMIVRNRFYSDKRRSWRVQQLDPKMAEETLVAVTNPTAALELDEVRRAMLGLSQTQHEALSLVAVAGMAYDEAAKLCRCAEGTIKSRVSRARQKVTSLLADGDLAAERRGPADAMASILADATRIRRQVGQGVEAETRYA